MIGAAGKAALHVVDNPPAINERAIMHLVAKIGKIAPAIQVGLGKPMVINSKAACGVFITKHHDTFTHRRVIIPQLWKPRLSSTAISSQNIKGGDVGLIRAWNG